MNKRPKTRTAGRPTAARPIRGPSRRDLRSLSRSAQAERQAIFRGNPVIQILALAGGLAIVVALVVDLSGEARRFREAPRPPPEDDPAALVLGLQDASFADPNGRFRLRAPASWVALAGPQVAPYDLVLRGPQEIEIAVRVSDAPDGRFETLARDIRRIERDLEVPMNIRTNTFRGAPAIERRARLPKRTLVLRDFLAAGRAHHLQAAAPRDRFDALEPLLIEILGTYEPAP